MNRPWHRKVGDLLARTEHRTAVIVVVIAIVMASLFVASYTFALGRPIPHHLPVGIVGDPAQHPGLGNALEAATRDAIELHPYASEAAAQSAIGERSICAALVVGPDRPRLLVASAASASVARLLELTAIQVSQRLDIPLQIVDVRPLPPSDPQGLASFYVTLGATIVGFITMFQLRANAPQLTSRAWLAYIGAIAVVGGLSLTLVVTEPVLGALHGPFAEIWGGLTAQIAVTALFCATMLTLIGRWAIIPTWLVFVVLGNASSGGTVAPVLLPPVYAFIGRFLPTGATVNIIHDAVYFRDTQHLEPFIVQAAWLVCGVAAVLLSARLLHHEPSRAPHGGQR
jgi:hypothetical protein